MKTLLTLAVLVFTEIPLQVPSPTVAPSAIVQGVNQ
jgi:hypothetical protein